MSNAQGTTVPESLDTDGPIPAAEEIKIFNNLPPEQCLTREQMEELDRQEDEESGEMDMDAWRGYTDRVQSNWNAELQRKADYADSVRATLDDVKERFKDAKTVEEKRLTVRFCTPNSSSWKRLNKRRRKS